MTGEYVITEGEWLTENIHVRGRGRGETREEAAVAARERIAEVEAALEADGDESDE